MSLWSDGNPNFSGGPPTSTATLTVHRSWVFYNATGASLPCKKNKAPCKGDQVIGTSYVRLRNYFYFPALHIYLTLAKFWSELGLVAFVLAQDHSSNRTRDDDDFLFAVFLNA
jgi:hypothetical protein